MMGGVNANQEENVAAYGGGGYGGYGSGAIILILLVVIVLWVLFRNDGHKDGYSGYGMPYGAFNGCAPCVQTTFKDESNWEQEYHLCKEIGKTDMDVWKTSCETQKEVHCEGEKTRALIEQNYIQELRDKLTAVEMEKLTLKNEMFTERKFDQMLAAIGGLKVDNDKQFCKTDAEIARLACELPKRPPVWSECVTPCAVELPERHFPRRGRCDEECFA